MNVLILIWFKYWYHAECVQVWRHISLTSAKPRFIVWWAFRAGQTSLGWGWGESECKGWSFILLQMCFDWYLTCDDLKRHMYLYSIMLYDVFLCTIRSESFMALYRENRLLEFNIYATWNVQKMKNWSKDISREGKVFLQGIRAIRKNVK